jgi:hypothetical protein
MIQKIFSVYDDKAEAYLQPFFAGSKGLATRSITDVVNDANHQFHKYAADFTLFELGEFDDTNGNITLHDSKVNLGTLIEYKESDDAS